MFELINLISDTVLRFLDHHGTDALIGVAALTLLIFIVRAFIKISERNGPKQDV